MTDQTPSSLAWMPLYISETKATRSGLTTLQFGALLALRIHAWNEPIPATLPDDDVRLASISGLTVDEWAANGDVLRDFFLPADPDARGRPRLVDPELRKLWQEQWKKYVTASAKGLKGGRPKGSGKAAGKEMEKLGETPAFQGLQSSLSSELKSSVSQNPDQSKAEEKPSLSVSAENDWMSRNPGKRLPLNFHLLPPQTAPARDAKPIGPYAAADEFVNSERAKREALEASILAEYESDTASELERYEHERPAQFRAHYEEAVKQAGCLNHGIPTDSQKRRIEEVVSQRIREELNWPSPTIYVSRRRAAIEKELLGV